jgi:hypothetical protein
LGPCSWRDQPAPNGAAMPPFVKQEDEVAGFESEAKKEEEDHFRDPQKESVVMLCNVGQVRPPRPPPVQKSARCAVRRPGRRQRCAQPGLLTPAWSAAPVDQRRWRAS